MDSRTLADRIRIEEEILSYVRKALCVAIDAPIEHATATLWLERVGFLGDSFGRHVARLFAIKAEGGYMGFLAAGQAPALSLDADRLAVEQRILREELRAIRAEARSASAENLPNLYALRQRMTGLLARLDAHQRNERDLWLDAFLTDIGGEG